MGSGEGEGGEGGGGESEAPEHSQDPPPSPPPLLPPSPPPPKFKLDSDGCVVDFDPSVDYYPVERRAMVGGGASTVHEDITFAKDFTITYYRTYKVLKNIRSTTKSYILQQCGTPDEYPNLPDEAVNATVFKVPLKKWSSGLTTSYTFMGKLGLWPQAVVVDVHIMCSPCGRKLVDCGVISAPPTKPKKKWTAAVVASGSQVHFTDYFNTSDTGLDIDVAFDASSDPSVSSASPNTCMHTCTNAHHTTSIPSDVAPAPLRLARPRRVDQVRRTLLQQGARGKQRLQCHRVALRGGREGRGDCSTGEDVAARCFHHQRRTRWHHLWVSRWCHFHCRVQTRDRD